MAETSLTGRTVTGLAPADIEPEEFALPQAARRREMATRVGLAAADVIACAGSMLVVSAISGAAFTIWALVLLPFYVLLAKMAGLYDRDQFILHKTTLDEAPVLVAAAAIFALVIEGVQALQFTGRSHPLLLWGLLVGALVICRTTARFLAVRMTGTERLLVIGDAASLVLVKRKLASVPGLRATVVGRVSAEGAPTRVSTSCWAPSTTCPP